MTRLTQISDDAASPAAAELYRAIKSKIGMVPNIYRVLANQPAALAANLGFKQALDQGAFDPKTREGIALVTAGANGCDYCASAHSAIATSLKVDGAEITANLNGRSADAKKQAILAFAKTVIETRGFVSDNDLTIARDAGLNESDIVETVANVVANIFTNYINHIAQTDIDFPEVRTKAA